MSKFKVGEIAILRNSIFFPERNETECLVIAFLGDGESIQTGTNGEVYRVKFPDEFTTKIMDFRLYKKKPPEETSSWEEIQKLTNWNPEKVTA